MRTARCGPCLPPCLPRTDVAASHGSSHCLSLFGRTRVPAPTHLTHSHAQACNAARQALSEALAVCTARPGVLLLLGLLGRERVAPRRAKDKGQRLTALMDGVRHLAAR
jgi:hypothetical protein